MRLQDTPELRAIVWSRVDSSGRGCWPWLGTKIPNGYGELCYRQRRGYAHRLVYELTYGVDPEKLFVCHHCDNPACCRPSHLFLGTHSDNMQDMLAKGRQAKIRPNGRGDRNGRRLHPERYTTIVTPPPKPGMANHLAKLTDDDVREILRLRAAGGISQREVGERFGVSQVKISQIELGKAWTHIPRTLI